MKRKEFEQIKTKPLADLRKGVIEQRDKLWTLRTDLAAGKIKNVKEMKSTKKNIAKLLTLIQQKQNN